MKHRTMILLILVISCLPLFWGGYHLLLNLIALFTDASPTWNPQIILFGLLFYGGWIPLLIFFIRAEKR